MHAMLKAADSVALGPAPGEADRARDRLEAPRPALRGPSGEIGRFVLESANTGEQITVAVNLEHGRGRAVRLPSACATRCAACAPAPRRRSIRASSSSSTASRSGPTRRSCSSPAFARRCSRWRRSAIHTRGMAADIRIPGMTPLMVRDLAASMNVPGDRLLPGVRVRSRRRPRRSRHAGSTTARTAGTARRSSTASSAARTPCRRPPPRIGAATATTAAAPATTTAAGAVAGSGWLSAN